MSNPSLTEALNEIFDADQIVLPVYPMAAHQVQAQAGHLGSPGEMKGLIEQDPSLVCNLFRAANSSFFKGLRQTSSLEEAITRLGPEKTVQVLEQACSKGAVSHKAGLLSRYLPGLWQHLVGCAVGAWWLSNRCGYQGLADQAYLAGLLHDIGKLFLLASLDKIVLNDSLEFPLSEQIIHEVLQTMHVEQGMRLIQDWNLPDIFSQVVNRHHDAELDIHDVTVALVKMANKGCHKIGLGWEHDRSLVLPTTAEAQFLGLSEIALAEFEIMLEDRFLGNQPIRTQTGSTGLS
jgi:HD-like signal output (HDOD) protein